MIRSLHLSAILLVAFACVGCSQTQIPFMSPHTASTDTSQQNLAATDNTSPAYALDMQNCNGQASKRLTMFEKPDTFPVSEKEHQDAYQALYSECMREHNWQVAGPVHSAPTVATNDAAQLAALSPAAGGNAAARGTTVNAGNTTVSSSSVPGATVVVIGGNSSNKDITAQLSSLSPSAGGSSTQGQNPTVVMIQSPQNPPAVVPAYYAYAQPAAPLPVAVPVPPIAHAPAAAPQAQATSSPVAAPVAPSPSSLSSTTASAQPSLASADAAVSGNAAPPSHTSNAATQQLEDVLEK